MFPLLINIMFVDKAVSAITLCSRNSKTPGTKPGLAR